MEKTQFENLVKKTKLQERAIRLARMVLIENIKPVDAAKKEGVTRQLVDQAVSRVLRQERMDVGFPDDWKTVVAILPQPMAQVVEYIQSVMMERAGIIVKSEIKIQNLSASDIEILTGLITRWRKK